MFPRTMQERTREDDEHFAPVFSEPEQPGPPAFADWSSPLRSRPPRATAFDTETVRPGAVLAGKYRVDRILGRRGRGVALQVFHLEVGHHGVLKYLLPEACEFPEAVASFSRGARAASRIQSEHAARIIDVGRLENGSPYIVSEYLRGSTLGEISRVRGPLSVPEAVDAVLQAGQALAEAHALGIVHRGLNPGNLILVQRSDGTALVKVCDFGIAEAFNVDGVGDGIEVSGAAPSRDTLAYLAPEQLRDTGQVDAGADIWSLGLVLHELLTGAPVFRAETTAALVATIAADPAPALGGFRADVTSSLEYAVLHCLEKDREFRHADMAELAIALRPHASPEGQIVADRIVKILACATRTMQGGPGRALVRVRPTFAEPELPTRTSGGVRGVWIAAFISIGGILGATLGATIAVFALVNRVPSLAQPNPTPTPALAAPAAAAISPVAPAPTTRAPVASADLHRPRPAAIARAQIRPTPAMARKPPLAQQPEIEAVPGPVPVTAAPPAVVSQGAPDLFNDTH